LKKTTQLQRDPAEQVAKAVQASDAANGILNHPAFVKAVGDLERSYIDAWRKSPFGAAQQREDAYFMLRALDELQGNLRAAAAAGGVVSFNLRRSISEKAAG
jgi:hypothetical protein